MQTKAIFAAGCFWGVQFYFDQIPGVFETTAGYTGGQVENPTYEQVCSHTTGHAEAVLVQFNPEKVSYETLVKHFFRMHDPTLLNSDGINHGPNYRSAIFYLDDEQEVVARQVMREAQGRFSNPIVTEVTPAGPFYPAEDYHQKYAQKTGRGQCHIPYAPL